MTGCDPPRSHPQTKAFWASQGCISRTAGPRVGAYRSSRNAAAGAGRAWNARSQPSRRPTMAASQIQPRFKPIISGLQSGALRVPQSISDSGVGRHDPRAHEHTVQEATVNPPPCAWASLKCCSTAWRLAVHLFPTGRRQPRADGAISLWLERVAMVLQKVENIFDSSGAPEEVAEFAFAKKSGSPNMCTATSWDVPRELPHPSRLSTSLRNGRRRLRAIFPFRALDTLQCSHLHTSIRAAASASPSAPHSPEGAAVALHCERRSQNIPHVGSGSTLTAPERVESCMERELAVS